jgi:hypothetical protein
MIETWRTARLIPLPSDERPLIQDDFRSIDEVHRVIQTLAQRPSPVTRIALGFHFLMVCTLGWRMRPAIPQSMEKPELRSEQSQRFPKVHFNAG